MMLAFTGIFIVVERKTIDLHENWRQETNKQIADVVKTEIEIAYGVEDGYKRQFFLPDYVNGYDYNATIKEGSELLITYRYKNYISFFSANITGNITKGYNEISKINNTIYMNCEEEPFLIRDYPYICSNVEAKAIIEGDAQLYCNDLWLDKFPCKLCCKYWTDICSDLC